MVNAHGDPSVDGSEPFRMPDHRDSELVIGLCGAVGTEARRVIDLLEGRLTLCGYTTELVKVSTDVIHRHFGDKLTSAGGEGERIESYMNAGNQARKDTGEPGILAYGVVSKLYDSRPLEDNEPAQRRRHAVIVDSLKHPKEVEVLRSTYPAGFFQIGIHADRSRRLRHLTEDKNIAEEKANALIKRDENEHDPSGQKVTDTFHLSDFFVRIDGDDDRLRNSLFRILDIMFGDPLKTPTFDEYAMFMAFTASLRSADLSRQVGAVIANRKEIVATGANDCPKFGGGLYWPIFNPHTKDIEDVPNGRDYLREDPRDKSQIGFDSNKREQKQIIESIVQDSRDELEECLRNVSIPDFDKESLQESLERALTATLERSRIGDLTEFGRVVHAEMEAILSCARSNVSTRDATLYCTTFPCHNCAKHIVAAGLRRVVYIEPYQKSKAEEFHNDSIQLGFSADPQKVIFEPFVGVGPRRFFDLFSTKLGSGHKIDRKSPEDRERRAAWSIVGAKARLQMVPGSYLDLEAMADKNFKSLTTRKDPG